MREIDHFRCYNAQLHLLTITHNLNSMLKIATLDKLAISLSAVCLVHCLLTPSLLTLIPIFSSSLLVEDALFHRLLVWLVLPTSILAFFLGCRNHKRLSIVLCGLIGLTILATAAFYGHEAFGIKGEKIATTIGGLTLAYSHFLNFRACQNTTCDDEDCSTKHHH